MRLRTLLIIIFFVLGITLYIGWSIGYNDGAITAVAIARGRVGYKVSLDTIIKTERSKSEVLKLRLTGQMDNWSDE